MYIFCSLSWVPYPWYQVHILIRSYEKTSSDFDDYVTNYTILYYLNFNLDVLSSFRLYYIQFEEVKNLWEIGAGSWGLNMRAGDPGPGNSYIPFYVVLLIFIIIFTPSCVLWRFFSVTLENILEVLANSCYNIYIILILFYLIVGCIFPDEVLSS